jgi:hypothetical protein
MLKRIDSYGESSIAVLKGSGLPCTAWGCRKSGRCREPWLETLFVNDSAIVALQKDIGIAFCRELMPSLYVSCMSLAVFTIVRMRWPARNESGCTVSADGAQPLRGFLVILEL